MYKNILIALLFLVIGLAIGYLIKSPEVSKTEYVTKYILPEKIDKTYDYRNFPAENIIFNFLWMNSSVSEKKYTCELMDSNLNVVLNRCNINMTLDNIQEGDYYLRFNYPFEFVDGGVENFISYFVVSLRKNGDDLHIPYAIEPAQYNDFPSIELR